VLRVLEGGEVEPVGMTRTSRVDVRVIAATNKDLGREIAEGRFREDLLFRLNVVPITSPPLRDRREDIPLLVEHFVNAFSRDNNYRQRRLSPAAMTRLQAGVWRGNVRELRNAVERLLIMAAGETIEESDVLAYEQGQSAVAGFGAGAAASGAGAVAGGGAAAATGAPAGQAAPSHPGGGLDPAAFSTLHAYREEAERIFLLRKLKEFRWNISRMAKAIETPRSNLYKKLELYGISRDQVEE
jgi:two-component system nitrogen regulation response regulator NtrX